MNETFPHDTSGGAASVNTVRGRSGSTVGPSGSHYIIGPLQKASGPRKKEKTAMCHLWDTHHKTTNPLNNLNSVKLLKRLSPPTPEEQAAFDKLREQLCHPPILAIPRKEGKYIIDVDASDDQLGCCLLQQQPDGKYLPVGYFSNGLLPAEKNYTVTEIEGLGVVWAVGLLRPYIEGTKFLIRCDHKALKWILTTTACTKNLLSRCRILLSEFD